eukprot:1485512-Amphidinium_carterae.1
MAQWLQKRADSIVTLAFWGGGRKVGLGPRGRGLSVPEHHRNKTDKNFPLVAYCHTCSARVDCCSNSFNHTYAALGKTFGYISALRWQRVPRLTDQDGANPDATNAGRASYVFAAALRRPTVAGRQGQQDQPKQSPLFRSCGFPRLTGYGSNVLDSRLEVGFVRPFKPGNRHQSQGQHHGRMPASPIGYSVVAPADARYR